MDFLENKMLKRLNKWGFVGDFENLLDYIRANRKSFDFDNIKDRKWLKSVAINDSASQNDPKEAEATEAQVFPHPKFLNLLKRWDLISLQDYASTYLSDNNIDLNNRKDRKLFRKHFTAKLKTIPPLTDVVSPQAQSSIVTESKNLTSATQHQTEALPSKTGSLSAARQQSSSTSPTEKEQVNKEPEVVSHAEVQSKTEQSKTDPLAETIPVASDPTNLDPAEINTASPSINDQAAINLFGTDIKSNDLGDFFPDTDGKVSSRMEKLFARLIEVVQDKAFYVDYGDYTDKNTSIKDPVSSKNGEFVFDGSGSKPFKGGRITGKGLNVVDSNYQGIASENWGKSDYSLIRLSDAEWGKVVNDDGFLAEQVGRPKGYQGDLYGVNNISTFVDPYNAITDPETGALTNTRAISNVLGIDKPSPANDNSLDYSILHMAFGQYTDHNMSFLARTSTGQGLASQVNPFDLPAAPFPPSGPPSIGETSLQSGPTDTLNLDFTQQPINSSRNNFGQLDIGKRKIIIPPGSTFTNATIENALTPGDIIFDGNSESGFITVVNGVIELDVFGLLEFLNEDGLVPASDIIFNFENSTSPLTVNIIPETGIIGGRGELYIVKDGGLVPVAYFDAENNFDKPAGFYEFSVERSGAIAIGERLLTNDADNRNKVVHRNRTESLIQNNQLYGATDLQNYYLRESARYYEEDGDFVIYRDDLGNVYRKEKSDDIGIGSIVRGDVQKNGVNITIENYKISSGVDSLGNQLREKLYLQDGRPADILKSSHMLSSAAVGVDGLKSLPTYSDVLMNNGVDPQLIKNIFEAVPEDQYFIGEFGPTNPLWLALTRDPDFIDFGNVEGYPLIGDISPRVFSSDRTSGAMRGLDQNDDNIADAFAILKYENDVAIDANPNARELKVRDFDGKVINLSENLQPKINAEDWGIGLLLSHAVGGDWRANENAGLTTLHTLWAREHSFHVDWINSTVEALSKNREEKREFNDRYHLDLDSVTSDDVFNMSRRMVEMEYQKVLYEQFAPSLVGDIAKIGDHGWDGFNPMVDPSVAEEFSNGSYRYGHSQIQQLLIPGSELFDLFLAPQYAQAFGFSGTINGMTQVTAAEVDTKVSETVRSNLLANKLDLKAANINRTRETGQANAQQLMKSLSGYDYIDGKYVLQVDIETGKMKNGFAPLNLKNGSDVTHGILGPDGLYGTDDDTPGLDYGFVGNKALRPFKSWDDFGSRLRGDTVTERNDLLASFMAVYDNSLEGNSVEDRLISAQTKIASKEPLEANGLELVDVWNYMLAEKPTGDHLLGPVASAITWEQFDRFQDGDAAYYLNTLDGLGGGVWNHTLRSLEDIIATNSTRSTYDNYVDSGFSEDVFKTTPVQAELTDPITGIFTPEKPFDPNSINNVDYLNGFLPGNGKPRINSIDLNNDYVLEANNAIYERVGANFANIASIWESNPTDPWKSNGLFSSNTAASIDNGERGQGTFETLNSLI